MDNVMIDIETLGNEGKFLVTQVAMARFDINTGEIKKMIRVNIDINDSQRKGFKIGSGTLKWWMGQDKEIFEGTLSDAVSIDKACDLITEFVNIDEVEYFWASAILDYMGISNLFDSVCKINPVPFYKRLCARTVRQLYINKGFTFTKKNVHDALEDCKIQIDDLVEQLSCINN